MELRQTCQGNKSSVLSLSEDIPLQPGEISRNFTEKQLCFHVPACILCGHLVSVYIQRPLAICPRCLLVSAVTHKIVIIFFKKLPSTNFSDGQVFTDSYV